MKNFIAKVSKSFNISENKLCNTKLPSLLRYNNSNTLLNNNYLSINQTCKFNFCNNKSSNDLFPGQFFNKDSDSKDQINDNHLNYNKLSNEVNLNQADYDDNQLRSFDQVLKKYLPIGVYLDVCKIVYGKKPEKLTLPMEVFNLSQEKNFEIRGYKIHSQQEELRKQRLVKIGAIQTKFPVETTLPIKKQLQANFDRYEELIKSAHLTGVNVLGLQETWTAPFFFCTREKTPWLEFAESALNGSSTAFLKDLAKKYNMVIVSPILERDDVKDTIWNTAVIIDNNGDVLGKHRKMHIPRVGDFNESTYYMEGDLGCSVFETEFGNIGVNICYGRHHPLHWMAYGLNNAEIVFNPSATVNTLSEGLWPIEARNAAIANSYFSVGINRVGTEVFKNVFTSGDGQKEHNNFGHFYGSSYVSSPDGIRTPGLSRTKDGLLVTEVDLNLCRQVKDTWGFSMTGRHEYYAKLLEEYIKPNFKPDVKRKENNSNK